MSVRRVHYELWGLQPGSSSGTSAQPQLECSSGQGVVEGEIIQGTTLPSEASGAAQNPHTPWVSQSGRGTFAIGDATLADHASAGRNPSLLLLICQRTHLSSKL
jgi:hypothetical protein